MIVAVVIILTCYLVFLVLLLLGWMRTKALDTQFTKPGKFYSILVPFRNERENLPALLRTLQSLNFPDSNFEVILINDHSEDDYLSVASNLPDNFRLIESHGFGKKAALQTGIEESKGDVIVTTDADCLVPRNWLLIFQQYFESQDAQMVFGPVAFLNDDSFFNRLQQIEFSSLIGSGAATLRLGMPTMCNGANLAFLKSTFYEVGGYADNLAIPSGDDEFLMHKVYSKWPEKVFYVKHKEAVVNTFAAQGLHAFISQRKRWASKWKNYKKLKNSILAVLVALFNLSVILATISLFFTYSSLVIIPLLIKIIFEYVFLRSVLTSMRKGLNFGAFLLLQICYPYYVVLFGLSANFGSYRWKGRTHKL